VATAISISEAQAAPARILSLDQCADQHVLALAPDADLYLSPRADDSDAWLRRQAEGRPRVRPTLETALAVRPDIVVRSWGGDPRLLRALRARGARIVQIEDVQSLEEIRTATRKTANLLGNPAAGEARLAEMDAALRSATVAAAAAGLSSRTALYLTAGGFTAGRGTLIDSILKAAGYVNAAPLPGFGPVSVERLVLSPPSRFVLGFFDQARADWRGAGRHPVVRRATAGRVVADLPGAVLTCPAWFAADAARLVAAGQP
jgi:iron complex transport system substrate-binding protein